MANEVGKSFEEYVATLEKSMSSFKNMKLDLDKNTKHYFAHGVYARELLIPKGCTLTGKIHRFSTINIISKGCITVSAEGGLRKVSAPAVVISPPGTKRAGHAHEDTVWITLHPTDQIDVDKVEQEVIAQSFYDFENNSPAKFFPGGLNPVEARTLRHLLDKQNSTLQLPNEQNVNAAIQMLTKMGYKVTK